MKTNLAIAALVTVLTLVLVAPASQAKPAGGEPTNTTADVSSAALKTSSPASTHQASINQSSVKPPVSLSNAATAAPANRSAQPSPSTGQNARLAALQSFLSRVSRTAWCCAAVFLGLTYMVLFRLFTVHALRRKLVAEEQSAAAGIPGDVPLHHPALLAIRKWSRSPAAETDRAYRWLDQQIAAVFGTLISQGEGLRTLSLNMSFAATIFAFVIATTGGHNIDRMLSEVSGALGATLFGLLLFSIESTTLGRLNAEAVRLEFEGRDMIDSWATNRLVSNRTDPKPVTTAPETATDTPYANPS